MRCQHLVRRIAAHLRQVEGDLRPLGRLVVDEGDGAVRELKSVGDLAYRVGLAAPADLRQHEVGVQAQLCKGCVGAVSVGDSPR